MVLVVVAWFALAQAHADDFTVSPGESIAAKIKDLKPGDTLTIKPGIYKETLDLPALKGTEAAPITIKGERGATLQAGRDGIRFSNDAGASWVVIDGLRITGARDAGVFLNSSDHVTLRNLVCAKNATWGIHTRKSDYITVENCDLSGSNLQHGLHFSSTDHPVARNNRIHDNAGCGILLTGEKAEGGDGLITGAVIENNRIYSNGSNAGSAAISLAGVEKSVIANNLIYFNRGDGIVNAAGDIGHAGSANQFYNNTVYFRPGEGGFALQLAAGTKDAAVMNNIFVGGKAAAFAVDPDSIAGLKSNCNIFFQPDGKDPVEPQRGVRMNLKTWQGIMKQDVRSLVLDPQFWNPAGRDFHLKATSKAIHAGIKGPVDKDIDGKPRPADGHYTLGIYEADLPPSKSVPPPTGTVVKPPPTGTVVKPPPAEDP
jgi:parallel beta-helix repeat protein